MEFSHLSSLLVGDCIELFIVYLIYQFFAIARDCQCIAAFECRYLIDIFKFTGGVVWCGEDLNKGKDIPIVTMAVLPCY